MTSFEALAGRRVVVIGASGFIGRWVARAFETAGARAWLTARDPAAARTIAAEYGLQGDICEVDLLGPADLAALVHDARPELVINMAGYGVDRREVDVDLAREINLEHVHRLIGLVSAVDRSSWRGPVLLHAGSALEYGEVAGHLDEDGPTNATTAYGRTKLAATRAIEDAVQTRGVSAVTARLFTVYGPGEHDGRLLPSVLAARSSSDPIPMTNGLQKRDFTCVQDVAEGFVRLACAGPPRWPTVNMATGRLQTVRSFVTLAERALKIPPGRFQFGALPTRNDDMAHGDVSTARLRAALGWVPAMSITEGVAWTAGWIDGRARERSG